MLALYFPSLLWGQGMVEHKVVTYYDKNSFFSKESVISRYFETGTLKPVYDLVTDSSKVGKERYLLYYLDGIPQRVSSGVSYKEGGFKRLSQYTDSLCWKHYNSDSHVNVDVWYTILFDKQLKIKEVKIFRRGFLDSRYDYEKLVKGILLSTEGNWEVLPDNFRWETNTVDTEYYFVSAKFHLP